MRAGGAQQPFRLYVLKHEFHRAGIGFSSPALCSVQLSRRLYPQFYKHSLDGIIERLGIVVEDRHRAMADVSALCDYLEYSLSAHGLEEWSRQCFRLTNPKLFLPRFPNG